MCSNPVLACTAMRWLAVFLAGLVVGCGSEPPSGAGVGSADGSEAKSEAVAAERAAQKKAEEPARVAVTREAGSTVVEAQPGQKVRISGDGTRMEGAQGTFTVGGGADGFPLPLFPEATVVSGLDRGSMGVGTSRSLGLKTGASVADVATFYERAMKKKGLETRRRGGGSEPDGAEMIHVSGRKDGVTATATAMRSPGDAETTVSLAFSGPP